MHDRRVARPRSGLARDPRGVGCLRAGRWNAGEPLSRGRRQALVLLLVAIVTGFAAVLLLGHRPGVGKVILVLSSQQGIHAGDLPVIGLWLLGVACGVLLWRDRGPDPRA